MIETGSEVISIHKDVIVGVFIKHLLPLVILPGKGLEIMTTNINITENIVYCTV